MTSEEKEKRITPAVVYRYVLDFIVSHPTPEQIAAFAPTPVMTERLRTLIAREKANELTQAEKAELDEYSHIEHLIVMLKAGNPEVAQDELAVSLAKVIAAANKRAREAGVDVRQSLITITQITDGELRWRINYGPKDYIGQRGGDLIVDVDASDANVRQVLHGQ
ncbi:MAG: hypothetical protein U0Z53_11735 [Blastocatellia bacterium]